MKITFEGATRVLDLDHVTLRQCTAVQGFTGLAVAAWQGQLAGVGNLAEADVEGIQGPDGGVNVMRALAAVKKTPMYTDPAWIMSVAAAHWLMLTQAGEEPPPLDDDYDCDVLGFYAAFMAALVDEVKAKQAQAAPKAASPARGTPSSRRTAAPKKPRAVPAPFTGS